FVARHSVVEKIQSHLGAGRNRIEQVERKEAPVVGAERPAHGLGIFAARMIILGSFTLNEGRVRPEFQDGIDRQQVGSAKMLQGCDEGAVILLDPLVPESMPSRKPGTHVDYVNRR